VDRFVVGCEVRSVERIAYSVNGAVQMTGEFLRDVIDWFVEPMAVPAIEPFEIRRLGGFDTTEQGFEYLGAVRTLNRLVASCTGNVFFRGAGVVRLSLLG
jgi:hypothetical protein